MFYLTLFIKFFIFACLSVGGFMASLPGVYRFLVDEAELLSPEQFAGIVAFGQSMPGPNTLISPLLGWAVGGPLGSFLTLLGTLLPAFFFCLVVGRWVRKNNDSLIVRSYKIGMAPLTVGLMFASAYFLLQSAKGDILVLLWSFFVALCVLKFKVAPLYYIFAGALVGLLIAQF